MSDNPHAGMVSDTMCALGNGSKKAHNHKEEEDMNKRYKITVKEMGEETQTIGAVWAKGVEDDGGYGYTPQTEAIKPYERKIYQQTVASLDLPALVSVVNKVDRDYSFDEINRNLQNPYNKQS